MLQEMTIENFAIISKLRVNFEKGMTVLTGETGAGKSIIIDAMGLLVGGRGSLEYIRQGAKKCFIEGLFLLPNQPEIFEKLVAIGVVSEEDDWQQLIVQREIAQSGKNTCRLNGRLVNTGTLKEVGHFLVDIHGQNEHQELMRQERHGDLLDKFGGEKLAALLAQYQKSYGQYRQLEKKTLEKKKNEQAFAQRLDMLEFQVEEISRVNLVPGEEETLQEERTKLVNFQKIVNALTLGYKKINAENGEISALERVAEALEAVEGIADLDERYQKLAETLANAYYLMQEVSADLSGEMDSLEYEEGRLENIEERLNEIRQLKRKYGDSIEKILAYYEKISAELASSQFLNESQEETEEKLKQLKRTTLRLADSLTEERKKVAQKLEKAISEQLKALYLEKAMFKVNFLEGKRTLAENGQDQIAFYLTTNPGEPLKPLAKVASGGEMSRIMLAMKTIFSESKGMTSIVFDEVDTGVSGRVAQAIADKIYEIARNSQVLCITHLPQVAACADTHYFIKKEIKDGRTWTSLEKLTADERELEIARMLAGEEITKLALEHAKELLRLAHKKS